MRKFIKEFIRQLREGIDIARRSALEPLKLSEANTSGVEIRNVVICGMGGSGISGNMVADIAAQETDVPIIVNKDYSLPHFVNRNTLVIISSYSGETEETVKAYEESLSRNAHVVCITSGGKIKKMAIEHKTSTILIPGGMPPCAAVGYSLVYQLYILECHNVIGGSYRKDLQQAIALLEREENNIVRDAKETAMELEDKYVIIYGTAGMESAALRFKQQLNENSKILCSHSIFPELNHNELQGWRQRNKNTAVVFFRNQFDYRRTSKHIDISKDIISYYDASMKEVYSKGISLLERLVYLVHWGDWVSYFLAERKGIDTTDIKMINYLKSQLSHVSEMDL